MTAPGSPLNLILFTADHNLQQRLDRDLHTSSALPGLTVASSSSTLQRATAKRTYDGLLLESKRGTSLDLAHIQRLVDPSRTFILIGPRDLLLQMARLLLTPQPTDGHEASGNPDHHLEHYFESKLADFVKGMKHGSASDLHPMLIKTVERPLISHALKVTNGNQIKTAHLLGMNRNTLRKKITNLRIPVNREKPRRARTGVSV